MSRPEPACVAVVGLGDLGGRVLEALAREPRIGRLVGTSRGADQGLARVGQAQLIAGLSGGAAEVEHERVDLDDVAGTAAWLARLSPDVVVAAASAHTWWREPRSPEHEALPYGAWLPLFAAPVWGLMQARREAGVPSPVVCLPFPDLVGPVLAGAGLAPEVGAGNVAEVAAKLETGAALRHGTGRDAVEVSLLLHHAAERVAFGAFAGLSGGESPAGEPPWAAEVRVTGEPLRGDEVAELLRAPHPLPAGRDAQALTAASAVATTLALLADPGAPVRLHAPAPAGRPGGYPVQASRAGVRLALPEGWTEDAAVALNARAAAWDGVQAVEEDGTTVFTDATAEALRRVTGSRVERLALADHDALRVALLG